MYIPKLFEVEDFESQAELIKEYPLGIIVSCNQGYFGSTSFKATHIPFVLKVDEETNKKYLIGHLAAKNDQIEQLEKASECFVIFQSCDSYITPAWYPTKKKTQKFVPTWDFAAVHVYGKPKILRGKEWKLGMLNHLTDQEEEKRPEGEQYEAKWKVSDAPDRYLDGMLKAIVGLEIDIDRIESKWKFDQNSSPVDAKGLINGLESEVGGEKGKKMAQMVKERYPKQLPE